MILSVCLILLLCFCTGTGAATIQYQYDANGNLIQGDGKHFRYNDANKLVEIRLKDENGPVIAEYVYDHSGQRIKKIENGVVTYYVSKHFEKVVRGANPGETKYYFANGQRVARKNSAGSLSYFHADHLGGTNAVTDSAGSLAERTKYYPFGDIREGGNERYTYTGKEKDKASEFYYFEARHYHSGYRHFTQADIIVPSMYDPQNLNRYAYVKNNPLKYIDPHGYSVKEWAKGKYEKGKAWAKDKYDKGKEKYGMAKSHIKEQAAKAKKRYEIAETTCSVAGSMAKSYAKSQHLKRNIRNREQAGKLTHEKGNIYLDEAGREWKKLSMVKNVFHNKPTDTIIHYKVYIRTIGMYQYKINEKYISGNDEIILTPKGENLSTGRYQQTYNFFNLDKNPILHGVFDVTPHFLFGANYEY